MKNTKNESVYKKIKKNKSVKYLVLTALFNDFNRLKKTKIKNNLTVPWVVCYTFS
ncbi:hypothetical protein BTS2_2944 [Bacillus sp. TS-2]|nr:hypothetical protein BTS2_2944 [Bacillus sp. TS-2]